MKVSKEEIIEGLRDYAEKMQAEHAEIDLSKFPEEKVNELKRIVYSATQSAMKQSFLVILIILF